METSNFNQSTWSPIVLKALRRIDWRKVIASVRCNLTEGPLPEKSLGIHDVQINELCNVQISRRFGWSLLFEDSKLWFSVGSLAPDRTDRVITAVRLALDVVDILWRALTNHFPWIRECKGIERSLQGTLMKYVCLAHDKDWAKFLKYHTTAFFCMYEKDSSQHPQELPSRFGSDLPGTLFVGTLNKLCRQKGSSRNSKELDAAMQYRLTVLQGMKKGFPLLEDQDVYESLVAGAKDLASIKLVPTDLLLQIERTAKEVFGKSLPDLATAVITQPYETISTHACIDGPRSGGGAMGKALYQAGDYHRNYVGTFRSEEAKPMLDFWATTLARIRYHPWLGTWEDRTPATTIHERDWLSERRESVIRQLKADADPAIIHGLGSSVDLWTEAAQEQFLLTLQGLKREGRRVVFRGILEPLKVRPISVSHLEANHIWQPIQKKMWKQLQKFPCFQLTGTPVTEEIIEQLVKETMEAAERCFPSMYRLMKGVSADFRAATNVLALTASLAAVEGVTSDSDLKAVMRNGLIGSWMHVMKKSNRVDIRGKIEEDEIDLGVQTNGQLMGCVFSFPLLCVINAAVTRRALELEYNRTLSLRECPMLINGDDMACFLTNSGYESWKGMTTAVGLEPSIGKNYFSDRFLMINSSLFDLPDNSDYRVPLLNRVKQRPFINFSFITGIQKTGCSIAGDKEELSEDHCLKAISTFSQSLEFHQGLPLKTQGMVEESIYERRSHLWSALGLSTGPSGFDLTFHANRQPDNRLDWMLMKLKWGPYRPKLDVPAGRYTSGPDYCGTWRLHQALVRTTDVWSECAFIRRAMMNGHRTCAKYKAKVSQCNSLTESERSFEVMAVRFSRSVSNAVRSIVKDWPNRHRELH